MRTKLYQETLEYGLDEVLALQPKSYFHAEVIKKADTGNIEINHERGRNEIGLVAQDVIDVIPEAVHVPEDESKDIWTLDYAQITTVLVKAVQQQQAQIEEQRNRISTLERQVQTLLERQ